MIKGCKELEEKIRGELKEEIAKLPKLSLHIITVGDDKASQVYVNRKIKVGRELGVDVVHHKFEESDTWASVMARIFNLNQDLHCTGIILQLPLPNSWRQYERILVNCIDPMKDVDGLTDGNILCRTTGNPDRIDPATPLGIIRFMEEELGDLTSKVVCILGRSDLVGRPLIDLCLEKNMTVVSCNSRTTEGKRERLMQSSDIVVVAIGKPKLIKLDNVLCKLIIDVGIHRLEDGTMCGDVDMTGNLNNTVTKVPGGVGLLTVACLYKNLIKAYKIKRTSDTIEITRELEGEN